MSEMTIRKNLSKVHGYKLIIKDFTKDIKAVQRSIDQIDHELSNHSLIRTQLLKDELYVSAADLTKLMNRLELHKERLECVVKTLLAARRPYENKCIKLRNLLGQFNAIMSSPYSSGMIRDEYHKEYDTDYQLMYIQCELDHL